MFIETPKGMSIYTAISYAKEQAQATRFGEVGIEFNGVNLVIHKDSLDLDIATIYHLECRLRDVCRPTY